MTTIITIMMMMMIMIIIIIIITNKYEPAELFPTINGHYI
jgi:hypothetical protein